MADAKVSELVSATSLGGSDQLYVVQSNTSKKITAATLFANAANVVLSGNTTFGGTPQTLGAPGIININTPITQLSADAIGGTLQIPNGASGQVKIVTMTSTAGGSYTFNTSNIAGNVNVTLDSVGDTVVFIFTNGKWFPITSTSGINLTSISSNVIPSANSVYDLGSATNQWRSLYVSNNTIFIGGTPLTITNGELVIGSGGSSANLATVAYVNSVVANDGGLTSADLTTANVSEVANLYYTVDRANTAIDNRVTKAFIDNLNIDADTLDGLNSTAFALDSDLTTANVSEVTNLYFTNTRAVAAVTNNNITLGNVTSTSLTTTDVTAKVGAATGNIVTNVRTWDSAGANLYIWFNAANTPELVTLGNFGNIVGWTVSVSGGNSATVTATNPAGYFSISTSSALTGSGTLTFTSPDYTPLSLNLKAGSNTFKFATDGILTLPGNLVFTANSTINSLTNSSGDGIGASTLQVVPDNALFNNDQYIIIDPTEPDHIHIRGGGAIDNCSAKLIIGGENSHFSIQTGLNPSVGVRANNQNWNFSTDGTLSAPGSISSDGIISTGKSKFDKVIESYSGTVNPTGNVTFDCSSSHIFNVTSINTNFTANITNLDLDDGEATSLTLVLNQGNTAYIANALQLSGTTQTIRWQANTVPTGNVNAVDVQTFSILNVNGNYTVLGQLTTFG